MKPESIKLGLFLSIILGIFLPTAVLPMLMLISGREDMDRGLKNMLDSLEVFIGFFGTVGTIAWLVLFMGDRNSLFLILPILNIVSLLLWGACYLWYWMTPLTEAITKAPESSDTLCRPVYPNGDN